MKLAEIRLQKGYTQANIAKMCGVDVTMISHIEHGRRRPSVNNAKKIADALGFDWKRFYDDSPDDYSAEMKGEKNA